MSRHLRYQSQEWAVHHVSSRCIQGFHFLKPLPEINAIIKGMLGYSLHIHKDTVKLINVVFLSNHFHLLLSSKDTKDLAQFMCHLKSNLAREIGRVHGWSGTLWEKRYFNEELLDEESFKEVFKYLIKNSVKEGLVDHPSEWPGVHGYHYLVEDQRLIGVRLNRTALCQAQQRAQDEQVNLDGFQTQYEVTLTPPPMWCDLGAGEYRAYCRQLSEEAIYEARQERERPPMGSALILLQPVYQSRLIKRERKPRSLCRARCPKVTQAYKDQYYTFKALFQEASAKLRHAIETGKKRIEVSFPRGGVPLFGGCRHLL